MKNKDQADRSSREGFAVVAQPGVLISNAWPQSRATPGATARAIEEVLREYPFFEAFQTVDVPDRDERRNIRGLLGDRHIPHTYTPTRVLGERKLHLSSLDSGNRRRACDAVIEQLDHAREIGACAVTVISGPRPPEPAARVEALQCLEDSLETICTAAAAEGGLEILIEPLDYEAHKRNTLGTTVEAVAICRRLADRNHRLNLCIDTAHLLLNGEDPMTALAQSRDHVSEFHFCNCVLDRTHALFGDHHLPFGPPGVVGLAEISTWMRQMLHAGYLDSRRRPRVYCEVWKPDTMTSLAVVGHCQDALESAWERARSIAVGH